MGLPSPVVASTQALTPRSRPLRTLILRLLLVGCISLVVLHWRGTALHAPGYSSSSSSSTVARAESGRTTTFKSFLNTHFPLPSSSPPSTDNENDDAAPARAPPPSRLLWLTLASSTTINEEALALELFVRKLNTEQQASQGIEMRRTDLVVLCLDQECLQECQEREGLFCYGGYRNTSPIHMSLEHWSRIAGVRDALRTGRDVLFVDRFVTFKSDPYPYLAPIMKKADLIVAANATTPERGHLNSGFYWMKSSTLAVQFWEDVLAKGMPGLTKLQDDFNEVLQSATLVEEQFVRGSDAVMVTPNGLRLAVFDRAVVRTLDIDPASSSEPSETAFALQATCAGESNVFLARNEGFWPDVGGYYTHPPSLLRITRFAASTADNLQILKIALAVAKYSSRSFEPPATAYFADVPSSVEGKALTVPVHMAFPLPQIASTLHVPIVEPDYPRHAMRHLANAPVMVPGGETSEDQREAGVVAALQESAELDIRNVETLADLLRRVRSTAFRSEKVLTITNLKDKSSNWRRWRLPPVLSKIPTCLELNEPPTCGEVCRMNDSISTGYTWPLLKEVMAEPKVQID